MAASALSAGTGQTTTTAAGQRTATRVVWFRDHCLRLSDNPSLSAAVEACLRSSSSSSSDDPDGGGRVLPVFLWQMGTDVAREGHGGTARDVLVARALGHLDRALGGGGTLRLGAVPPPVGGGKGAKVVGGVADELARICQRAGATEVYYPLGADLAEEEALRVAMVGRGLRPVPFGGAVGLLEYVPHGLAGEEGASVEAVVVPWADLIRAHPFRSPLLPFEGWLLGRLAEHPPPPPVPVPRGLREVLLLAPQGEGEGKECFVTLPESIDALEDGVGVDMGGGRWGDAISEAWPATEEAAMEALERFLRGEEEDGGKDGEEKDKEGKEKERTHLSSGLSPYLARGLLSPRQLYHRTLRGGDGAGGGEARDEDAAEAAPPRASFVRRICWREYSYALAALFPDSISEGRPVREAYYLGAGDGDGDGDGNANDNDNDDEGRPGTMDADARRRLRQWREGRTGFPLVDAAMRQLREVGWMPQKARLAASACLVEGMGVPWEEGMGHFARYLADHDAAINSAMWQNAGCVGFDPYYAGSRYKRRPYWDRAGGYVRRWVPELADLPDRAEVPVGERGPGGHKVADCLYEPWTAPRDVLERAGVVLGDTYPVRDYDERVHRSAFFRRLREVRRAWPDSLTDERGLDNVALGREVGAERIGMFTPLALLDKRQKDS